MPVGQEAIWFITADSHAAAAGSPQLEALKAQGIEVLLLSDRVDEWMIGHLKGRPCSVVRAPDGITVQQFNEGAGGQVVFHLHIHVIPRAAGVAMKPPASEKEKPEVLAAHAQKLAAALKG